MSNDKNKIVLLGLVISGLLFLLFYFGFSGRNYSWFEHYRPNSKDPYGTYLVHELLKEHYPGKHFRTLKDSIPPSDSLGNFIFIGKYFELDSMKNTRLLNFVEAGNDAFIASTYFSIEFIDTITNKKCIKPSYSVDSIEYATLSTYFTDSIASLNLIHKELKEGSGTNFKFLIRNTGKEYEWNYFITDLFCREGNNLISLGHINSSKINFIKINYGDGNFYLHHTPLAFTNIHLLDEKGLEYAERVISHLEPRPIYWDGISFKNRDGGYGGSRGRAGNIFADSPLRYILSQPALKWAWYTLLGMAILYLIFKAKRRQRIIPILEKNENTSLEFIGTIGRLHFIESNHHALAKQKMMLFLGYVRERYHLSTKEINKQFENHLIDRSEVPENIVKKIFTINRNIENSRYVSENVLVDLHHTMAQFYQNCK